MGQSLLGQFFDYYPLSVQKLMSNRLYMLDTWLSIVVMKHPNIIYGVPVNYPITGNNSQAFVLCELQVLSTTLEEKMFLYFLLKTNNLWDIRVLKSLWLLINAKNSIKYYHIS